MKEKTKSAYSLVEDGEPILITDGTLDFTCCDCGLTHHITFSITDKTVRGIFVPFKGKLCLKLYRDEYATRFHRIKKHKKEK